MVENDSEEFYDVLVIGAGISGIGAAYYLSRRTNLTFRVLESKERFGGTWELFKYPGIRSDSDMYSFAYSFHPWTKTQRFGSGDEILEYLREVLDVYDLEKFFLYNRRVISADFSTESKRWRLVNADGQAYSSRMIVFGTGYYDHDEGHLPEFEGYNSFRGTLIHPQKWPTDINLNDRDVVIIGSGATAVTLAPSLTKVCKSVTMLQRSPTYIAALPDKQNFFLLSRLLIRIFGKRFIPIVAKFRRCWEIVVQWIFYKVSKAFPHFVKRMFLSSVQMYVGKESMKHFTPKYMPWDQRVCACPDGDFYRAYKHGKLSIVTDHIKRFSEDGIELQSGDKLKCDTIVTATGLKLVLFGKINVSVDGVPVKPNQKFMYKGFMLSDVPNAFQITGYTNASWTLKVDITCEFICRIANHMSAKGWTMCVPRPPDGLRGVNIFDLTSGYIQRHLHEFPKQGDHKDWKLHQNYLFDYVNVKTASVNNSALEFS